MMGSNPFIITQAKPKPSQPGEPSTHVHIWQIDRHNVGTCSLCGEVKQFPWDGRGPTTVLKRGSLSISQVKDSQAKEESMAPNNREKHQYYEQQKEQILADLRSIGRPATRKKWNLTSSTIHQLESRWLTPQETKDLTMQSQKERRASDRQQKASTTPGGNTHNHLPSFPEFSNEWAESVQIKWFELYEVLTRPNFPLPPSSP